MTSGAGKRAIGKVLDALAEQGAGVAIEAIEILKERIKGGRADTEWARPYIVLGVLPGTPLDEIEALYRVKVAKYHPDTGSGDLDAYQDVIHAMGEIRELER